MTNSDRPPILFLDFDGVMLDSARETAVTTWRAGRRIWPEDWSEPNPPDWLVDSFRRVRPLLHTGFEAFGLMRLAWLAEDAGEALEATPKTLERARDILRESGWRRDHLIGLFGETRDLWLRTDFEEWLSINRFYPGTVEALRQRLARDSESVFVVTTKQDRFVAALADRHGLELNPERVVGLDRGGRDKPARLLELSRQFAAEKREMRFVEDRLATLLDVAGVAELNRLGLYLAVWGYVTAEDCRVAADHSRIQPLRLERFVGELLA